MIKKTLRFFVGLFFLLSTFNVQANSSFAENLSEKLTFCSPVEQQHYEYIHTWAQSDEALALWQNRAIHRHNLGFNDFLTSFVNDAVIRDILDRRVHIDFTGRKIITPKEPVDGEDIVDEEPSAEQKLLRAWLGEFQSAIEVWGAKIYANPSHEEPGTVVFSFDMYPEYVVKCLAWNRYHLGCYDDNGLYSCCVPGCTISGYDFPLQLVSRVLYSEEIKRFVVDHKIENVYVPEKWLYIFPWAQGLPFHDKNLFVIAQKINFTRENQEMLLYDLKGSDAVVTKEMLLEKAANLNDHSVLANMVRVIVGVGVWDFSIEAENFVLLQRSENCGDLAAVFIDTDRPAFGGGNPLYFFHKKAPGDVISGEMLSNGRVGLNGLVDLLNEIDKDDAALDEQLDLLETINM